MVIVQALYSCVNTVMKLLRRKETLTAFALKFMEHEIAALWMLVLEGIKKNSSEVNTSNVLRLSKQYASDEKKGTNYYVENNLI